jgi:hypothetical protein
MQIRQSEPIPEKLLDFFHLTAGNGVVFPELTASSTFEAKPARRELYALRMDGKSKESTDSAGHVASGLR